MPPGGCIVRWRGRCVIGGFTVVVLNPRQARDLARATEQLAKTDRVDDRILVTFGDAFPDLSATRSVTEEIYQLRDLPAKRTSSESM